MELGSSFECKQSYSNLYFPINTQTSPTKAPLRLQESPDVVLELLTRPDSRHRVTQPTALTQQWSSCHGLSFLIHIFQLSEAQNSFVQGRVTLPSQENKNQPALTSRHKRFRESPQTLCSTFSISSPVLTPAEGKTAVTFLPNVHFHKAATSGQKRSFDYMLTQFFTQTSLNFISC